LAFIPVPDCVEVTIRFLWQGQSVAITLSFCRDTAVTLANMQALADDLEDWFETEMAPLLSVDITTVAIGLRDLTDVDSFVYERSMTIPGEVSGITVSNNVTTVVTFETGLAGRSFRGRNYIPGINQSNLTNSVTVGAAWTALLLVAYNNLSTYVGGGGWSHCVVSRYSNGAARDPGIATEIIGYSSDGFIDSQRRRLAGRGD